MQKILHETLLYCLIVTLSSFSFGCSPPKALPIDTHLQLYSKKIAIVPSSNPIQSDLDLYANGRLEGGIKGAGTGFVKGVGTISPMLECNDPITCSVALLFFVTAGAVGATVGAVTGAVDSPAGGKVDKVEEALEEKITSQVSQMTLAGLLSEKVAQNPMIDFELVPIEGRATMLSNSDYEALRNKGFHELISVNLTQIEFEGGRGKDPLVTLKLKAVIEIVDLDRPQNIIKRKFVQVGPSFYLDGWSAKSPEAVKGYFESVLQQIAADMYHQVFVQFDLQIPPRDDSGPGSATYGCCWICPEDPPLEYSFQRMKIEYPVVESVRPTLKWFDFPSLNQAEQFKKSTGREIQDVYYDLRVWDVQGNPVYQAKKVFENYHSLNFDLEPFTDYHWSVRGCFSMEGKEFCTRWSRSYVPDRGYDCHDRIILGDNYYRFRTPPMAGIEVEKGSKDEKYSNNLEGAEEPNKVPAFNKGDVVLVIFKNGQTKEITITHIDGMFVVGYVYYSLGQSTGVSYDRRGIKSIKHLKQQLLRRKSAYY